MHQATHNDDATDDDDDNGTPVTLGYLHQATHMYYDDNNDATDGGDHNGDSWRVVDVLVWRRNMSELVLLCYLSLLKDLPPRRRLLEPRQLSKCGTLQRRPKS